MFAIGFQNARLIAQRCYRDAEPGALVARSRRRPTRRPRRSAGDAEADVAVVGGGYTGLWTALALSRATRRCG